MVENLILDALSVLATAICLLLGLDTIAEPEGGKPVPVVFNCVPKRHAQRES